MSTPNAEDSMEGVVGPDRRRLPGTRGGITHKVEITGPDGVVEGYIIANLHEDGSLGEIFLQGFGKQGSTLDGWVQLSALLFSVSLQFGAEFDMLARKISHMKFPPYGTTNNPHIPKCRSVPDYIMRWLAFTFGSPELCVELEKIHAELERTNP